MADIAALPKMHELQRTSMPLMWNGSGVYFLFDNDDQGCNCLLRVAEHTRKIRTRYSRTEALSL